MDRISIRTLWTLSDAAGNKLSHRLLELLVQVSEHGSLSCACRENGSSYRHAWNLVQEGERPIGSPLLVKQRGKGSTLTDLAEKLVWADRRISARLTPMLQSLASELEVEIGGLLDKDRPLLRVHASHGFAIEKLFEELTARDITVERKYVGSREAVDSLHRNMCDMVGFPVPVGEFEAPTVADYAQWLDVPGRSIVHMAERHLGLLLAPGNPKKIYGIGDLARDDVRFVNRQLGSGTRHLLDMMLGKAGIDAAGIAGYEQGGYTHAAIAAYVASDMADVGLAVETPARRFGLDFVSLVTERYFLLCREESLHTPDARATLAVLRSDAYRAAIDALPGYSAERCGEVESPRDAFSAHLRRR